MEASQSLASRRHRPSQAKVRSTIQRRAMTTNPVAPGGRLTISISGPWVAASASFSLVAGIAAVDEYKRQGGKALAGLCDDAWRAVSILNVGAVCHQAEQVAVGVGHDVALAALGFLARVVAARSAALGGLHRLAVDYPGRSVRRHDRTENATP